MKIDKWNIQEIRVCIDDILCEILKNNFNFKQNHFKIDIKILLLIVKNIAGCLVFLPSFLPHLFDIYNFRVIFISVFLFLLANFVSYLLHIFNFFNSVIFEGNSGEQKIQISSNIKASKNLIYFIDLHINTDKDIKIDIKVTSFIDEKGNVNIEMLKMQIHRKLKLHLK